MASQPDRICKYVVERELARGGMGIVYRAVDPALGRAVAIKALAPTLTNDAATLARFEREAKVLASLGHANIAAVYGLEKQDGELYLIMELVEGESLASRLRRGRMPIEDVLSIAAQVAAGIEAAHESGVVHRDIKPGNVMVQADKSAKVLDFGLAYRERRATDLAESAAGAKSALTQEGHAVGTPGYMSPEQARGGEVDRRSDIFSFGCMLFEMLSGEPPFAGDTTMDILVATLETTPDWSKLPPRTPPRIRELLEHCLEKQPRRRLRHMGDALLELQRALDRHEWSSSAQVPAVRSSVARRRLPSLAFAGLLLALAVLVIWSRSGAALPQPLVRFTLQPPQSQQVVGGERFNPSISADGSSVVYSGGREGVGLLYVRQLQELEARPVAGSENATESCFSPDGKSLAFVARGRLMRMAFPNGTPEPVTDVQDVRGIDWGPDGNLVFADRGRLLRVPATGGAPQPFVGTEAAEKAGELRWPKVVAGGAKVLATAWRGSQESARIAAVDTKSGSVEVLELAGMRPFHVEDRYLVFAQASGRIAAVRFDLDRSAPIGTPMTVVDNVDSNFTRCPQFAVSRSGSLVYSPAVERLNELVLVDRSGTSQPLPNASGRAFQDPRFSPAGDRVSVGIEGQIWLYEVRSGTLMRRTDPGIYASWMPDGRSLCFSSQREGLQSLYVMGADGGEAPTLLYRGPHSVWESEWSADGAWLVYREGGPGEIATKRDLFALRGGDPRSAPIALLQTDANESMLSLSPDGRRLAYVSDQTGQMEVYVRPFPEGSGSVQVSIDGGSEPSWDREGKELFYRTPRAMAAATFESGPSIRVAKREDLFPDSYIRRDNFANYDVDPVSGRLLMVRGNTQPFELVVAVHWVAELRARLGD